MRSPGSGQPHAILGEALGHFMSKGRSHCNPFLPGTSKQRARGRWCPGSPLISVLSLPPCPRSAEDAGESSTGSSQPAAITRARQAVPSSTRLCLLSVCVCASARALPAPPSLCFLTPLLTAALVLLHGMRGWGAGGRGTVLLLLLLRTQPWPARCSGTPTSHVHQAPKAT